MLACRVLNVMLNFVSLCLSLSLLHFLRSECTMLLISFLKILYHEAKATIKYNETNRKDQMRLDSDIDDDTGAFIHAI